MSQSLEERVTELERFQALVSAKLREHLGLPDDQAKDKRKAREEKTR